jgi:hypothetical protein
MQQWLIEPVNPRRVDPDTYRRYSYPRLVNRKNTDLDAFMESLRHGDRENKEVRSNEGYITLGSDDGEEEGAPSANPFTPEVKDKDDLTQALELEYKKARALPKIAYEDDEEERAKKAFREMYYKKKALAQQQIIGEKGEGSRAKNPFEADNKTKPLAQQENAEVYLDEDDEWRPYVPEKDDDEWEFEYYMSLKPVEVWSPIDEY